MAHHRAQHRCTSIEHECVVFTQASNRIFMDLLKVPKGDSVDDVVAAAAHRFVCRTLQMMVTRSATFN